MNKFSKDDKVVRNNLNVDNLYQYRYMYRYDNGLYPIAKVVSTLEDDSVLVDWGNDYFQKIPVNELVSEQEAKRIYEDLQAQRNALDLEFEKEQNKFQQKLNDAMGSIQEALDIAKKFHKRGEELESIADPLVSLVMKTGWVSSSYTSRC